VRADAPTLRAIFGLAAKHDKPLNVHAQWDRDTAREIEALADSQPAGKLIVSHCGSLASAADIRGAFERHPNLLCDLSFRSPPQLNAKNVAARAVFDGSGVRGAWKQLIEDYPERFMVGLDDQHNWDAYDLTAQHIRVLLSELSPSTAEKVAYKNAQLLFRLQ
jgi:predicted TIM-barrel fold metal-dependent hydrolase